MKKYRFLIIGAGKVGSSLCVSLYSAGFIIDAIVDKKIQSAKTLARKVKCDNYSNSLLDLKTNANVIAICVQDSNIKFVVEDLIKSNFNFKSLYCFHTSGCLSSEVLKPLSNRGAKAFSLHPNFSFAKKRTSLEKIPVAVESSSFEAVSFARFICRKTKAHFFEITKEKKSVYHALAVMFSNYLNVLFNESQKLFGDKTKPESIQIYRGLIESTLKNISELGSVKALTGPIARGDIETVKENLRAIEKHLSQLTKVYKELGLITLELAEKKSALPKETITHLLKIFTE
ncbi:MAG: DUF2520 domain-containing protein [Ignavibacteria bacterium]|nr:DUF2520 domain-containing protein [Ignavibacteria bacterium]